MEKWRKVELIVVAVTITVALFAVTVFSSCTPDTNPSPDCPCDSSMTNCTGTGLSAAYFSFGPSNGVCGGKWTWPCSNSNPNNVSCCVKGSTQMYYTTWTASYNPVCGGCWTWPCVDEPGRYCVCRQNVTGTMYCTTPAGTTQGTGAVEPNPHCPCSRGANYQVVNSPDKSCYCNDTVPGKMFCTFPATTTTLATT